MSSMETQRGCDITCELFGRSAQFFEVHIVPHWQEVYDALVNRAGIMLGSRVLDVGSGTGEVALRLCRIVGQSGQVVAVDAMEEMLTIARKKAHAQGVANLELKQCRLEGLTFLDATFDRVLGNYSLCCCLDYKTSLSEILRVLKPGGRLVYNHGGPTDSLEDQISFRILEKFMTASPSRRLVEIRESDAAQSQAVEKYRDPFVVLDLMRALGYDDASATIAERVIRYANPEEYVDRLLGFDWRAEADEMTRSDLESLRSESVEALRPVGKGPGFQVRDKMVFFSGLRPEAQK